MTSSPVVIDGFYGPLTVTISSGNEAQFSIDDGEWTSGPATISAGQTLRVRHKNASEPGTLVTTTLTIGLPSGVGAVSQTFTTLTAAPTPAPALETLGALALGAALVAAGAARVQSKDA